MSEDDQAMKAVSETASAAQEVAKTTGKGIEAVQEIGAFVARFLGGPLEQASGIVEDKLKYIRWERCVRYMQRAEEFLGQQGLQAPTRSVPMKIAIPILEAASMEEDDDLQDIWARLLVNAADADSGSNVTRSLVTVLQDFGPLEVQLLQAIHDAPAEMEPIGVVPTMGLPHEYLDPKSDLEGETGLPPEPIQVALWHLVRLGCIGSAGTWDSIVGIRRVQITALGRVLVKACTLRGKS